MRILSQKRITQQSGFTLVEIIIAVAVISVLAGIGTTMLLNALPNMRIKSAARDVYSALMQTKNEALRRGVNVGFLVNTAANTYLVFLDSNSNGAFEPNPPNSETALLPATGFPANVTFDPTFGVNGTDFGTTLAFTLRGIPNIAALASMRLQATDSQGAVVRTRTITVSPAGRVNVLQN